MQSNNIFGDLSQKIATVRKNSSKSAGKELLTAIEKEGTNDAQMWLMFSFILFIASAVTIFLGYKYYRFTFDTSYAGASLFLSISLSSVVEVGKVFLTYAILSGFIFGWAFKNWAKFFGYCIGAVLAFGTYFWSYNTSTEGVAIYAKETASETLKQQSLEDRLRSATADLDEQIAAIQGNNKTAETMKTKKGKITWKGQETIQENSTTLSALQKQKAERETAITSDWQKNGTNIETKTNILADWIQRFGGYTEWAVLFCLLAMIFFDKDSNDRLMSTETATKVRDKIIANNAKLTAEEMEDELKKASTMNGSYKSEPLGKT